MAETIDFLTFYSQTILPLFIKTILTYLSYGIYFVLFCVCMFFHYRHSVSTRKPFQRTALIAMFVLATATVILDSTATMKEIWIGLGQYWGNGKSLDQETIDRMNTEMDLICGTIVFLLYVVTNFIADLVLIQRNSVIWNGRRLMVWIPLAISIMNNALAIVGISCDASNLARYPTLSIPFNQYTNGDKIILAYLVMNACLNFCLTGCLAGRIWWIARKTSAVLMAPPLKRRYNSTVALTLESGILYPIALIISVATTVRRSYSPSLYPFLVQVVGIAPTLIVVRTVLGLSVERTTGTNEEVNSTMLNTFSDSSHGNRLSRFEEKGGIRTANRSSFGNRFAVPLYSPGKGQSQTTIPEEDSVADWEPEHLRGPPGPRDDAIQTPTAALSHSHSDSSRPFRSLPVLPRGSRLHSSKKSVDKLASASARADTPPLNIVVHTAVEQVSEYAPRLRSMP